MIVTHLDGLKELQNLLKELPGKVENKVLQAATHAAMREALPDFQRAAPKHKTGEQSEKSREYGSVLANLKVVKKRRGNRHSRGTVISTGDAFWGSIYEEGSRYQPARPWFMPVFRKLQQQILGTLKSKLGEGIKREADKLARK